MDKIAEYCNSENSSCEDDVQIGTKSSSTQSTLWTTENDYFSSSHSECKTTTSPISDSAFCPDISLETAECKTRSNYPQESSTTEEQQNYFALNSDNSDECSSDEGQSVKKMKVEAERATEAERLKHSHSCQLSNHEKNLKNLMGPDAKKPGNPSNNKLTENTVDIPESSFWTNSLNVEAPEVHWNVTRPKNKEETKFSTNNPSELDKCRRKPYKTKQDHEKDSAHMKSGKQDCFFVHHNISPYYTTGSSGHSALPKKQTVMIEAHSNAVNHIEWCNPQFSHLLLSVSMDSSVKIWNVFSKVRYSVRNFSDHRKGVKHGVWSNSGRQVLTCGYDNSARIHDVEKGVQIQQFDHRDFVTCVRYHPVRSQTFVCGSLNCLYAHDTRSGKTPVRTFHSKDTFGQVQDLCITKDGSTVFSCSDLVSRDSADRNIMAWDFGTGALISNQIYQERFTCTALCLHPRQPHLLAQSHGNYVAIFSTVRPYKMDKYKRFEGHKVEAYSIGLSLSADGRSLVSGSADGAAYFYDYNSARKVKRVGVCEGQGACLDGRWHPLLPSTVAFSSWNGRIFIWQ